MNTLITGLAEFVSAADRQHLEAALARQTGVNTTRQVSPCRFATTASRWSVQCDPVSGQPGPSVSATLSVKAGRPISGQISRFRLPGGTALSNIALISSRGDSSFTPRLNGQQPRTAEGHALARLSFRPTADHSGSGEVALDIREDFAAIDQAVATLLESPAGETLFGPTPIPRRELFTALLGSLGAARSPACCEAADTLPPPRLEVAAAIPGDSTHAPLDEGIQRFYPYCATCHRSAETFPPNFLTGNGPQVVARLRHCAPRLFVRLAMADLAPDHRDKTPMPPESMLPAFASDIASWKNSPIRTALLDQVSDWLRAENGRPPNLNEMLAGGYESLRPCLPTQ